MSIENFAHYKSRLDFYAREYWLEWDESFHEFAELVIETGEEDLAMHADIIADNLLLVVKQIWEVYIAGDCDIDELIKVAQVQSWIEKLDEPSDI